MTSLSIIVDRIRSQAPIDRAADSAAPTPPNVTHVRAYDSNGAMRLRHSIPDTPPPRYHRAVFVELP